MGAKEDIFFLFIMSKVKGTFYNNLQMSGNEEAELPDEFLIKF